MWKQYRVDIKCNTAIGTILKTDNLIEAYDTALRWRAKGFDVELTSHHIHVIDLDCCCDCAVNNER